MNLFEYPQVPGWKRTDTSKEAAEQITPHTGRLQQAVFSFLKRQGPSTTREIAEGLGVDYDSIQPRTSELRARHLIEDSGERRPDSKSGKRVIVWRGR